MTEVFELYRYRIRQLLSADGFLTVWYDESAEGAIRLRTSKPLYVGLADVTVEMRKSEPTEIIRTDKAGQQLVSVCFGVDGMGMEIDDECKNCLGLIREGDDIFKVAESGMDSEQFARVVRN